MNQLDIIKNSVDCLIKRDIKYAVKFIESRDFESLKELIDSNLMLIINNRLKPNPNKELEELEESDICLLKYHLENYLNGLK